MVVLYYITFCLFCQCFSEKTRVFFVIFFFRAKKCKRFLCILHKSLRKALPPHTSNALPEGSIQRLPLRGRLRTEGGQLTCRAGVLDGPYGLSVDLRTVGDADPYGLTSHQSRDHRAVFGIKQKSHRLSDGSFRANRCTRFLLRRNYFNSTEAPAALSSSAIFSASSLETPALTV